MNGGETAAFPLSGAVRGLVLSAVWQVVSLTAYTFQVTEPVGAKPPETVAVSVTDAPAVTTDAEGLVDSCGAALFFSERRLGHNRLCGGRDPASY